MSDQGICEWCGGPIPPRSDPRGQRARFCRPAHRAAAHRARAQAEHDAEVEEARSQMVLPVESLEERQDVAVATLRDTAEGFLVGKPITDSTISLVEAARQLVDLAEPPKPPEPATTKNRRQRRAVKRTFSKKR